MHADVLMFLVHVLMFWNITAWRRNGG